MIHHSASTLRILQEMSRVLRPGGQAVTMVYHRGWRDYYLFGMLRALRFGFGMESAGLHAVLRKRDSRHGQKLDWIPLPSGSIKRLLSSLIPNSFSRLLAGRCRMGSYLVSRLEKPPAQGM